MTIWATAINTPTTPARSAYRPPYKRTGKVLIDSLLFTAHLYGCQGITLSDGVLRFKFNGAALAIPITPTTRCMTVLDAMFPPDVSPGLTTFADQKKMTGQPNLTDHAGEQRGDPSVDTCRINGEIRQATELIGLKK